MLILLSQNISFAGVDVISRRGNSTRCLALTCFSTFSRMCLLYHLPTWDDLTVDDEIVTMHPPWSNENMKLVFVQHHDMDS
jgi:hypothetical protein